MSYVLYMLIPCIAGFAIGWTIRKIQVKLSKRNKSNRRK